MKLDRKQLVICSGLGILLSAVPLIVTSLPGTSSALDKTQQAASILLLPSLPLSLLLSQGNIHDSNLLVIGVFDCAFYTGLFYLLIGWFAKRKSRSSANV